MENADQDRETGEELARLVAAVDQFNRKAEQDAPTHMPHLRLTLILQCYDTVALLSGPPLPHTTPVDRKTLH